MFIKVFIIIPSSLYSLTLSMFLLLHLIFTLLELSSWCYCVIYWDDITFTFVLFGLKTKFVSFNHTSAAFGSLCISFEHLLFFYFAATIDCGIVCILDTFTTTKFVYRMLELLESICTKCLLSVK